MFGFGRGFHRRNRWRRYPHTITPAEGYTYVGPCRCGFGPHAFYQDDSGRIIHASQIYHRGITPTPSTENLKTEIDSLKKDKQEIEKRINELEENIKEKEK